MVDGDVLQEMEAPQPVVDGEAEPVEARPTRAGGGRGPRRVAGYAQDR